MDWMQEGGGRSPATSSQEKKIPHKRVHWRALALPDANRKLPGHIVEVTDSSLSLQARYTFPVGTNLQIAIFVPDSVDRSRSHVVQIDGRVSFQVMRGDEVQTGLNVRFPDSVRSTILAAVQQEK